MLFTPRRTGRWASRLFVLAALLSFAAVLAQAPAAGQSYPNRALKFIVPYPAGGSTDIIVRLPEVAARLNAMGLIAVGSSPEEFAAMIKADAPERGKVIKGARIRID